MDRYTNVSPGLRLLARTVPGMVLAYAMFAEVHIVVSDALILAFGPLQQRSPRTRIGRVGPAYLPPVGAGGAFMKETVHA